MFGALRRSITQRTVNTCTQIQTTTYWIRISLRKFQRLIYPSHITWQAEKQQQQQQQDKPNTQQIHDTIQNTTGHNTTSPIKKIVFFGSDHFSLSTLQLLHENFGAENLHVITPQEKHKKSRQQSHCNNKSNEKH